MRKEEEAIRRARSEVFRLRDLDETGAVDLVICGDVDDDDDDDDDKE